MKKAAMQRFVRGQIFVLALAVLGVGAADRSHAEEHELPCSEELAKYCKDVKPGGGRILDCLNEHQKELSVTCKKKLEESKKRLMEAQRACTVDVEKFCKDVRPGGGRIFKCLGEHTQELSPACKQEIETAKGRVREKQTSGN